MGIASSKKQSKPGCKRKASSSPRRSSRSRSRAQSRASPWPDHAGSRPPCSSASGRAGRLGSPEPGARRHLRPRRRRHPISAREAGGAGSLASPRGQRRAPVCEVRGAWPPCRHVAPSPRPPEEPHLGPTPAHLLAEALDLGLGELLALVQLLDPLVQLLGEQLLVHDDARPNRLPLRAAPAPPPAPGPHAHAAAAPRGASCGPWRLLGAGVGPLASLRSTGPPAAVPPPPLALARDQAFCNGGRPAW